MFESPGASKPLKMALGTDTNGILGHVPNYDFVLLVEVAASTPRYLGVLNANDKTLELLDMDNSRFAAFTGLCRVA